MPLNELLSKLDKPRIVFEASLNNTILNSWPFHDHVAGVNAQFLPKKSYESNSNVRVSNGSVFGASVNKAIAGDVIISRSLAPPFDNAAGAVTASSIRLINNKSSDDLRLRNFEDERVSIKVGGLINRNKSDEELLNYDDYEDILTANFTGFNRNRNEIDINVGQKSTELTAQFPPNIFLSGDSEGLAKPYIYGIKEGFAPPKVGQGLYVFHDGQVGTNDAVLQNRSYIISTPDQVFFGSPVITDGEIGSDLAELSDYSWVSDTDTQVSSGDTVFSVNSGFDVTPQGSRVRVSVNADSGNSQRFVNSQFRWATPTPNRVENTTDPKMSITSTGDVEIFDTNIQRGSGTPHVRLRAAGTGNINIEFDDIVDDAVVVVRNVIQSFQTIDNFSPTPNNIEPTFTTDETQNHRLTYNNVGSNSISFDYTSTTDVIFIAIWVESVTLVQPRTSNFSLQLSPRIAATELEFNFSNATDSVEIGDQIANQANSTLIIEPDQDPQATIQGVINSTFGNFTLGVVGGTLEGGLRGVTSNGDNGFIFNPSPSSSAVFRSTMPPMNNAPNGLNIGQKYLLKFDVRLIETPNLESINILIRFNSTDEDNPPINAAASFNVGDHIIIPVTPENLTHCIPITLLSGIPFSDGFDIVAYRGQYVSDVAPIVSSNANVDHKIELTNLSVLPTGESNSFNVLGNSQIMRTYINSNQERINIPMFRVEDAREYANILPLGLAFYDDQGNLAVSPEYTQVFGDFNGKNAVEFSGNALENIALVASGRELATSNVTNKRVGFAITDQRPFIDHIADLCRSMDYYYLENETTEGVTIFERYDFLSEPQDFIIRNNEIVFDSYSRNGSQSRPYRYVVEYRRDDRDSQFTRREFSEIGNVRSTETKTIESVFYNQSDNQDLARRILRDSITNDVATLTLDGIQWDLQVGQAGFILSPEIGGLFPCILDEVNFNFNAQSDIKTTTIVFKVLKRAGAYSE